MDTPDISLNVVKPVPVPSILSTTTSPGAPITSGGGLARHEDSLHGPSLSHLETTAAAQPVGKTSLESSAGGPGNIEPESSTPTVPTELLDIPSKSSPKEQASTNPKFGDLENYWVHFDEAAKQESDGMIKGMKDNLDNLLIFAALFSAVNSGFLVLSLPMLSDDPSAETNNLLRLLLQGVDNSTLTAKDLIPPPFDPSPIGLTINQLFSTSLTLSLLASFGALLAQQWIVHYTRQTPGAFDGGRWERERRYAGAERWRLRGLVEIVLPILLQGALFAFIIGFIVFLRDLSTPVSLPNYILAIIGASAFVLSSLFAAWDLYCPFHTPFTTIILIATRYCILPFTKCLHFALFIGLLVLMLPLQMWREVRHTTEGLLEWLAFDVMDSIRHVARRQQEKPEVVQGLAVHRFLDTTGHAQLLKATAVNLPLLDNAVPEMQALKSVDNRLARLSSLFGLAASKEEKSAYATAIMHVALTEATHTDLDPILGDIYACAAQAHYETPRDNLPCGISSVATVVLHYLRDFPDGSSEEAQKCVDFLCQSISRVQQPSPAIGALLGIVLVLRTTWKGSSKYGKDLHDLQERYDLRTTHAVLTQKWQPASGRVVGVLRQVIHKNSTGIDIQLLKLAFSLYDSRDSSTHHLARSLIAWTSTAIESMDWSSLASVAPSIIQGLENLFVEPKVNNTRNEMAEGRRLKAQIAALDVVSNIFIDKDRVYDGVSTRLRRRDALAREFSDTLLKSLRSLTVYAEALGRQRANGNPCTVEKLFACIVQRLHEREGLRDTESATRLRRSVALLPLVFFGEVKDWVIEALESKK